MDSIGFGNSTGWVCPKCGYVYSPTHYSCDNCNRPDNEKYTTTSDVQITFPPPCEHIFETTTGGERCLKCGMSGPLVKK